MWKKCGYLSISKKGTKLTVMVKHERYIADLNEIKEVLDGKRNFTLVYAPPSSEEDSKKEKKP